jgi:hypothetical protein
MGFTKDLNEIERVDEAVPAREQREVTGGFRTLRDRTAVGDQVISGLGAEHRKTAMLMANGIVGQALIDQVTDTGITVNDNPRVEFSLTVTIPGRDPYPAKLTQVVSRLVIGNFQPGATVPVRVSPEDPLALMIA